ncbi:MAG TPA: DUF3592 domain-containing protein [Anaerolineales bacterium]|nr:DUF3592 domain-containing protein [Anaerolineales bacterium]
MPGKKYSINWENEEPVSFEVDGLVYESVDAIPDEVDREKIMAMMNGSLDHQFEKEFREFDREFQKDWEAHKKTAANAERIILGVFSVVAVLMLFIALISSASAILKLRREASASGQVVEMIHRWEYVDEEDRVVEEYYFPVVEYVSADGRPHRVQMTEGSSTPQHEIGDEVTVLYNPERPLDARIQSVGSSLLMWILPGISGILGLAFLVAVLAVRKVMAPGEKHELAQDDPRNIHPR